MTSTMGTTLIELHDEGLIHLPENGFMGWLPPQAVDLDTSWGNVTIGKTFDIRESRWPKWKYAFEMQGSTPTLSDQRAYIYANDKDLLEEVKRVVDSLIGRTAQEVFSHRVSGQP